jgi:hypothetical protein
MRFLCCLTGWCCLDNWIHTGRLIRYLGCQLFNVSTFRHHVSLGRNVKHNDFFVTLEQRNVERKRNFLRSNVIFTKISRFATFRSNETWNAFFFTWDKRNMKRNNSVSLPFSTFDRSTVIYTCFWMNGESHLHL